MEQGLVAESVVENFGFVPKKVTFEEARKYTTHGNLPHELQNTAQYAAVLICMPSLRTDTGTATKKHNKTLNTITTIAKSALEEIVPVAIVGLASQEWEEPRIKALTTCEGRKLYRSNHQWCSLRGVGSLAEGLARSSEPSKRSHVVLSCFKFADHRCACGSVTD